jgi:hypothetical protein
MINDSLDPSCIRCPLWPRWVTAALVGAGWIWLLLNMPTALERYVRHSRMEAGQCPECGYPVGQNPVCTECGKPLPVSCPAQASRGRTPERGVR